MPPRTTSKTHRMDAAWPRRLWRTLEPVHALTYFSPESTKALKATGLRGYWMCYFAARSAPMGAASAPVVEATFYNFAPWLVRRAIPDAWTFATPDTVLEARWRGVGDALASHAAALPAGSLATATTLLERAVDGLCCDGRGLAAGNASLPHPDEALAAAWQLITTLREFRGDGHLAALVCAELSGIEAHVSLVGAGAITREVLRGARGFTEEEWDGAERALLDRGLLEEDRTLSEAGWALRRDVEAATDRAASAPWSRLGDEGCEELLTALAPLTESVAQAGVIPTINPIGLPSD
jgi:hypothetical protein